MYGEFVILFFILCYYALKHFWTDLKKIANKKNLPAGPVGLPFVGYLPFLGKVPCVTIAKLSKKWGKFFRLQLGQYSVVFMNDFDQIKEAYKMDVLQGRLQLNLMDKRGRYGLVLLEGEDWKEVKRFVMKCLRDFGFGKKSMEDSILEEVQRVQTFLKENTNKPLYLKPLIEIAVINALWYIMTSEKYDISDPIKQRVAHVMSNGLSDQNIIGMAAFMPWLAKLAPEFSGYNKGLEYFGAPEDLAKEIINSHIENYNPDGEKDFIDLALKKIYTTTNPKSMFYQQIGMRNLHYTVIDLFFAGSDTMSSTLGWGFLYLSLWPDVQNKVHDEIDCVVGRTKIPSLDDRPRMPYTEATMCEVLRMSSMVPLGLFHTALDEFSYGGYDFPKGTIFLANLYHVLQDPEYWGDPENFRPERFITEEGNFRKDERVIPFFTGKRSCPGESLAMVEYFLFFAGIIQNFTFSLDPESPVPDIGPRSGFILPPPEHKLLVHERLN